MTRVERLLVFLAGAVSGAAAVSVAATVVYRSELQIGSLGEAVTALVALGGLGTVGLAWRDYVHRYAANVGVSVTKPQGSATLKVEVTNGNAAPVYRCVVRVLFVTAGDLGHEPITIEPGVGGVLHPGPWSHTERMDRLQIPDVAELRFSDGYNRRWVRDSRGHLRASAT